MSLNLSNTKEYSLVIDSTVNPWIKDLNISDNTDYLNNLINVGYIVSKSIKFTDPSKEYITKKLEDLSNINNHQLKFYKEQHDHKIDFLTNKLDTLSTTMRDNTLITRDNITTNSERVFQIMKEITGKTNVSAHKGQIGENFIFNILDQAYPNANIESLVSTPHQADIHIKLEDYPLIFIESKNYTNTVPKKEISKFKDDLDRNNCQYGIFYSFNNKITGIHSRLYIENYNNKKILYVSQIEFNGADIIFPLEFLKYIINNSKSTEIIDTREISKKAESIIKVVADLEELYTETCKNITVVEEQRTNIVKCLDLIQQNALRSHVNTRAIVEQIRDRVSKELVLFLENETIVNDVKLNLLEYSDKIKQLVHSFISILPKNYIVNQEANDILCYNNNSLKIKLTIGKTKIKCKIIEDDCTLSLTEKNICKIPKYLE